MKYKIGDRVRITTDKSKSGKWNKRGEMDKWLGKVMTVKEIHSYCYTMEEDCDDWCWFEEMIDGLADEQKIVITTDGRIVKASLYNGKKLEKTATAKCSPEDEFDFKIGAELAFNRLFDKNEDKYFTGKAVCTIDLLSSTKGKIYNFKNGYWLDDDYDRRPIRGHGLRVSELESNGFIAIKE